MATFSVVLVCDLAFVYVYVNVNIVSEYMYNNVMLMRLDLFDWQSTKVLVYSNLGLESLYWVFCESSAFEPSSSVLEAWGIPVA